MADRLIGASIQHVELRDDGLLRIEFGFRGTDDGDGFMVVPSTFISFDDEICPAGVGADAVSERLANYDVPALVAEAKRMDECCGKTVCVAPTVHLLADLLAEADATLAAERAVRRQLAEALARVEPELVPHHDAAEKLSAKLGLGPLGKSDLIAVIRAALAASDALDSEPPA